ncbi:DUF3120 domain-containing protein [Chlorogloeopsis fritschii PCC 9212]|uniref:DUF3120 domain-containing protein n=1 Tax=Chlorogloeopsis fritschii PCC 6912 TaxID=211165 RepID=A0A3S0Y130_CHLFR|nr:hypothetical protein PCC6912_53630 [Chlorogloeopsis fritschii PCC 6912]
MVNNTLSSYTTFNPTNTDTEIRLQPEAKSNVSFPPSQGTTLTFPLSVVTSARQIWLVFAAAVFLVSVPVFIEAPLVRSLPWLSLSLTGGWVWLSFLLMSRSATYLWGDLIYGFSWSWLAGSIYWGWLRWEPLWHLPVESIGLPFVIWCLRRNWGKVGNWFYLGSLLGTVLTDVYFYLVDLMPYWRQIMQAEPEQVSQILRNAVAQIQTPWGQTWAIALALVLMTVGILPLRKKQWHWYAFGGAVLSTILVDSLFLLAAVLG